MEFDLEKPEPIRLAILGSTGSVGRQALDVVRSHPDRFRVVALAAATNSQSLLEQAAEFDVGLLGLSEAKADSPPDAQLIDGPDSAMKVAEASDADVVLNAVVGAAGLKASLATVQAGKVLALANKESLVAAGELIMAKSGPGQIRPVDSEHSAMWQLLEGTPAHQIRRVVVTGSGGPFRGKTSAELENVSVDQALAHPVWAMGKKITIDSATLMNKGLEVIEAHFLFGFTYDEIDVLIHPQGVIHAMAEAVDGSFLAYAAHPDMQLPIQLALAWPDRLGIPVGGKRIEWAEIGSVTFEAPDTDTFKCLALAFEAGRRSDTFPAALNAANEIAVQAFIEGRIGFLKIADVVESILEAHESTEASLEGVLEADAWARERAAAVIAEAS
jgi:1-deoxy-D-xylulose-5-phosphate reductoisomerase